MGFASKDGGVALGRTHSFNKRTAETMAVSDGSKGMIPDKKSSKLRSIEPMKVILESNLSFKGLVVDQGNMCWDAPISREKPKPNVNLPEPEFLFSPTPVGELDDAATKLQKAYKGYRTRRNLADYAVVVEELWWKTLDVVALKKSSVSFFNDEKPETAVSKWARAGTRAAKVGKGLSKDEKAQKLALQHWLEAIDPRHRYGHNLHLYYDVWFKSESTQPFFYWLDIGHGRELSLPNCSRTSLQQQWIQYLGPREREAYEVIVREGRLVYRKSGVLVETTEGSKWIFVLSTTRSLYVGQKKKGRFQHSSFLSGGATSAAGRLVAHSGVLEAIWPYSGHYLPTEENFREFISFLEENHVDLKNVEIRAAVDDSYEGPKTKPERVLAAAKPTASDYSNVTFAVETARQTPIATVDRPEKERVDAGNFDLARPLSRKWTTGAGPRIGCVRDYPVELQTRALEQVNLSPRVNAGPILNSGPIPSPRPSPKVRLSPRLACMGLPSPRAH